MSFHEPNRSGHNYTGSVATAQDMVGDADFDPTRPILEDFGSHTTVERIKKILDRYEITNERGHKDNPKRRSFVAMVSDINALSRPSIVHAAKQIGASTEVQAGFLSRLRDKKAPLRTAAHQTLEASNDKVRALLDFLAEEVTTLKSTDWNAAHALQGLSLTLKQEMQSYLFNLGLQHAGEKNFRAVPPARMSFDTRDRKLEAEAVIEERGALVQEVTTDADGRLRFKPVPNEAESPKAEEASLAVADAPAPSSLPLLPESPRMNALQLHVPTPAAIPNADSPIDMEPIRRIWADFTAEHLLRRSPEIPDGLGPIRDNELCIRSMPKTPEKLLSDTMCASLREAADRECPSRPGARLKECLSCLEHIDLQVLARAAQTLGPTDKRSRRVGPPPSPQQQLEAKTEIERAVKAVDAFEVILSATLPDQTSSTMQAIATAMGRAGILARANESGYDLRAPDPCLLHTRGL